MYLDTSYVAKFYFNESAKVRKLVRGADVVYSSFWAFAEFHAVLHRRIREEVATLSDGRTLASRFGAHIEDGLWKLIPVTDALLQRTSAVLLAAPPDLFLRAADAVHLVTAQEAGEREVWTNDRHMLAAAGYFGLAGRKV